jgi:hypothetical protein
MGELVFDGLGPYEMPVSQGVKAFAEGSMVALHIRLMTSQHQQGTVVVRLSCDQAVYLAGQLGMAAGIALKR